MKRKKEEDSAGTSILKSTKINFDDGNNFDVNNTFDVDMFSLTNDSGDNVVTLEKETSPHTTSTAYHSGSSNSIISTSSISAATD